MMVLNHNNKITYAKVLSLTFPMIDPFRFKINAKVGQRFGRFVSGYLRWLTVCYGTLLLLSGSLSVCWAAELPKIVDCEVGLGNSCKLGLTTQLMISVQGGEEPMPLFVMAVVPDSDGMGVGSTVLGGRPLSTEPGLVSEARVYTRIGKQDGPIQIKLIRGSKVIDEESFSPYEEDGKSIPDAVGASHRVWLTLGSKSNVESLLNSKNEQGDAETLRIASMKSTKSMPLDWIGYEGIDIVWLVAGDGVWLRDLSRNDPQLVALRKWVQSGGKLILSCGSAGADLLASGKPLVDFIPGEYDGIATLRRTAAIEAYAGARSSLDLQGGDLSVSRILADLGTVEASEGGGGNGLPLITRQPFGLGEVTFVAFDLDSQAIADWSDKNQLLRRLVTSEYKGLGATARQNGQSNLGDVGAANDYNTNHPVRALIAELDTSFGGVSTTPFIAIVGLVIAYLFLIGPGDYWFTVKWLKRPEVTWISFPVIVILTSLGAYLAAAALKGDQLRVNQIDLIDVDVETELGRGLAITHMFSPEADRYSLALKVMHPNGAPISDLQQYCSWLGKPGYGLGGMQGSSGIGINLPLSYQQNPLNMGEASAGSTQPALIGMPVKVWSTKSLMSRWLGEVSSSIDSELLWNEDRLVEGIITNDFGRELTNCRLLAGDWAWRLGDLGQGETSQIDATLAPLKIATLLKDVNQGETIQDNMLRISLMGRRLNPNRMQIGSQLAFSDLSHQLAAGKALLLAECHEAPSCELIRGDKPLASEQDKHWVYCRFILSIDEPEE